VACDAREAETRARRSRNPHAPIGIETREDTAHDKIRVRRRFVCRFSSSVLSHLHEPASFLVKAIVEAADFNSAGAIIEALGRPVGVAIGKTGALLVALAMVSPTAEDRHRASVACNFCCDANERADQVSPGGD
jgi:hypothetical protein